MYSLGSELLTINYRISTLLSIDQKKLNKKEDPSEHGSISEGVNKTVIRSRWKRENWIRERIRTGKGKMVVVVHTFNPSTWEAEAGRFLSSRPA